MVRRKEGRKKRKKRKEENEDDMVGDKFLVNLIILLFIIYFLGVKERNLFRTARRENKCRGIKGE